MNQDSLLSLHKKDEHARVESSFYWPFDFAGAILQLLLLLPAAPGQASASPSPAPLPEPGAGGVAPIIGCLHHSQVLLPLSVSSWMNMAMAVGEFSVPKSKLLPFNICDQNSTRLVVTCHMAQIPVPVH